MVTLPSDDEVGPDIALPSDDDDSESPKKKPYARRRKQSSAGRTLGPRRGELEHKGLGLDGCALGPDPHWQPHSPFKVLELFSGTCSVGKAFAEAGHSVVSIDITDKGGHTPTHLTDILEWNYTEYAPGSFHFIWASPPCEHYSRARTTAMLPRNLEYYDRLVAKAREIIDWFGPEAFVIENPATGLLRTRKVVDGLPFKDVDYCVYGAPYRKRTRLWGRLPLEWRPRELCRRDCHACGPHGRHKASAQNREFSLNTLHTIPQPLVWEIVRALG